jgi:hypothetical protein|tara:strand:- start:243 stop:473 length:231 start_codon:yes stop_codon:yes gene_type:complete
MDNKLHLIPKGEEEYFSSSEQSHSSEGEYDDELETPSPREHPKYYYEKEMKDRNYERLSHFLFGLIIGYLYKDYIS